jgi:hypothetical protein
VESSNPQGVSEMHEQISEVIPTHKPGEYLYQHVSVNTQF